MATKRQFWNGRWGRLARHDVLMTEVDGRWSVEDRIGGVEGRSRFAEFDDEHAALGYAESLRTGDGWREL